MSDRKNIEYEIFEKLENATTKIAQKVFDVLNRAYAYEWLKKYIKREYGYNYLYDVVK